MSDLLTAPVKTSTGRSLRSEEMIINMGPQHPSTHGVLRLELVVDGEIVVDVIPHIGYLHRCFEKHSEHMTNYQQVIPYCDRMDYVAAMNMEMGYVVAVEKLLGIQVPERVEYIRVIMNELQRIASHLIAAGTYGLDVGAFTPFLYMFRDRERILDLFETTCGARLLYNYIWVGGLSHDLPPGFIDKAKAFCNYFRPKIKEYNDLLTFNEIFIKRTANVGVLPADVAIAYGCSGPMLRGSGVDWDLRRDDPYSIYDRFSWEVQIGKGEVGTAGDCWDRYMVRIREMEQSLNIIEQALAQIPEGDIASAIPRRIRPNAGEVYVRTESARGELGFYVVSDGSATPYRVKARSPSFVNLSVLPEICRGSMIADVVAITGSTDIVLGEVDR
ncbi:MAG: NADH-quinone oxidoreductase subunit D [Ignavibacteriae bacterium]|nr:NADH-quinone oxidoreductase subunit D [Ignavibacteria bacterium]MBI3363959.1 NADH-quinone oxidoreductase subunit D [Ignavibacteriota bacterium]